MKISCTDKEKKRLIDILERDGVPCIFDRLICIEDDCRACLEERIKWNISAGRNKRHGNNYKK